MEAEAFTSWAIATLVCGLLASFALYLFGLSRLSHSRRPPVARHDRFGRPLGNDENEEPGLDLHANPSSKERRSRGRRRRR